MEFLDFLFLKMTIVGFFIGCACFLTVKPMKGIACFCIVTVVCFIACWVIVEASNSGNHGGWGVALLFPFIYSITIGLSGIIYLTCNKGFSSKTVQFFWALLILFAGSYGAARYYFYSSNQFWLSLTQESPLPSIAKARRNSPFEIKQKIKHDIEKLSRYGSTDYFSNLNSWLKNPAAINLMEDLGYDIGGLPHLSEAKVQELIASKAIHWQNPAIPVASMRTEMTKKSMVSLSGLIRNPHLPLEDFIQIREWAKVDAISQTGLSGQYRLYSGIPSNWYELLHLCNERLLKDRTDAPLTILRELREDQQWRSDAVRRILNHPDNKFGEVNF
jgi:hypothetical protein